MPNDRAAVAREATLQLVNEFEDAGTLLPGQAHALREYINREYPAPKPRERARLDMAEGAYVLEALYDDMGYIVFRFGWGGDDDGASDVRIRVPRKWLPELMALDARVGADGYEVEHPAPPAPETVTVDGVTYTQGADGDWYGVTGEKLYTKDFSGRFLRRIASDARVLAEREARIAEVEHERDTALAKLEDAEHWRDKYEAERDAALRALEEFRSLAKDALGTRQRLQAEVSITSALKAKDAQWIRLAELGEGLGKGQHEPSRHDAAASAPIPLGAVVEFDGRKYRRDEQGVWQRDGYHSWHGDRQALDTLYRALHPVATRETVERAAEAMWLAYPKRQAWDVVHSVSADRCRHEARAALSAAGFTLEGTI